MLVTTFQRDRFTWLAYLMLGYYAYMQAILGPVSPFLRAELALNYTVTGFHLSAFALGMLLAGATGERLAARVGRGAMFWGGGLGMIIGALLLISGRHPAVTVSGGFTMGFLGSYLLVTVQSTLSAHHGDERATGLTEANIVAAVLATLAPIAVANGVRYLGGWRYGFVFGALYGLLLFLVFRATAIPSGGLPQKTHSRAPLPTAFWAYWVVGFTSVSAEWCIIFWGGEFLESVVGLSKANAAELMSGFFAAIIIGRIVGSRLTRKFSSKQLLTGAIATVCLGFPIFWLARIAAFNVAGLFIAGLGVANLFPLTLAAASNVAPDQPDAASARVSLAAGAAILIVPQALGTFADQVGIQRAFAVVAAMLIAVILANRVANRLPAARNLA